jgi:hypothetical protein
MLQVAFTSTNEMETLLTGIINSMYSGDNYDEFMLMKNIFSDAVNQSKIVSVNVPHIETDGAPKTFVSAVKDAVSGMMFPSSAFNKYYDFRPDTDKGKPIITWTPTEDQILIVRADVMNKVDLDVLAVAFNMDKASFLAQTLKVDAFPNCSGLYAVLCDRSWLEVRDNLFNVTSFQNGQGLYNNFWLNHWQTLSFSLFANAIAFVCTDETISLDKTTLTFTTTATQTISATVTPNGATVDWITSDKKVATVSGGVVTPVANGTCYITGVNGDAIQTVKVTVTLP